MILGFKKQFVRPILMGEKIHTIRVDKIKRWKPDRIIHFSTNVRTPTQYQFHFGRCTRVEEITISRDKNTAIIDISSNDGRSIKSSFLIYEEIGIFGLLCKNDGLSASDFIEWFVPKENDFFKGRIIHWTNSSYT